MRQTWVIADDLTGAADSGVAFARPGQDVRLDLGLTALGDLHAGGVRIVDTDTRDAVAADVPARLHAVLARIGPDDHVLKKVDSLLRGRIAEELRILRDGLPGRLIVVAPAVPAMGRTTSGGHVRAAAMRDLRIADHLPAHLVHHVGLDAVRAGAIGTAAGAARAAGADAIIYDAETDDDLDVLVRVVLAADEPVLWVGAAGLAAALGRARFGPDREATPVPSGRTVLVVVGSHTATGRAQVRALAAAGIPSVECRVADLLAMTEPALPAGEGATVVSLAGDVDPVLRAQAATALAATCAPAVRSADVVVLSGGATARAVLTAAGVTSLRLLGEPVPGAVLSQPCGTGTAHPAHVITKSGSFGDEFTLVRLVAAITAGKGRP
jgi:uncharacterized protein YgbK (DUF1537 family)